MKRFLFTLIVLLVISRSAFAARAVVPSSSGNDSLGTTAEPWGTNAALVYYVGGSNIAYWITGLSNYIDSLSVFMCSNTLYTGWTNNAKAAGHNLTNINIVSASNITFGTTNLGLTLPAWGGQISGLTSSGVTFRTELTDINSQTSGIAYLAKGNIFNPASGSNYFTGNVIVSNRMSVGTNSASERVSIRSTGGMNALGVYMGSTNVFMVADNGSVYVGPTNSIAPNGNGDTLVIRETGLNYPGISIMAGNTNTIGTIYFGSPISSRDGRLQYDHTAKSFEIIAGDITRLLIGDDKIETTNDCPIRISRGASGATTPAGSDDFVIEDDAQVGMAFLGPDAFDQTIYFCNPSDALAAEIKWNYSTAMFQVRTRTTGGAIGFDVANGTEAMQINDDKSVRLYNMSTAPVTASGYCIIASSNNEMYVWDSVGNRTLISSENSDNEMIRKTDKPYKGITEEVNLTKLGMMMEDLAAGKSVTQYVGKIYKSTSMPVADWRANEKRAVAESVKIHDEWTKNKAASIGKAEPFDEPEPLVLEARPIPIWATDVQKQFDVKYLDVK